MNEKQQSFKDILKEAGLKVTNQRVLILTVLSANPGKHLTTEEIYDLVKSENPDIGLATVYRTLQLLLDLNLIDRISLNDGFVRYEIAQGSETDSGHHHHHLICAECDNVFSFEDDLLEELEEKITLQTGFEIIDHEVKMYGYCKDCKENH